MTTSQYPRFNGRTYLEFLRRRAGEVIHSSVDFITDTVGSHEWQGPLPNALPVLWYPPFCTA
jgi:hypothetical protein